jgi:3D (Asp-Asp-Asp) domain-containing protein
MKYSKNGFVSTILKGACAFMITTATTFFAPSIEVKPVVQETNRKVESLESVSITHPIPKDTPKIATKEIRNQNHQEEPKKQSVISQQTQTKALQVVKPKPPVQTTTIQVRAFHYTANCSEGCSGTTAIGIKVKNTIYSKNGLRVIAVDPRVIPLGKVVTVKTPYGTFNAIAGDTGGAIKGHKIDILVRNNREALNRGVVKATVTWKK